GGGGGVWVWWGGGGCEVGVRVEGRGVAIVQIDGSDGLGGRIGLIAVDAGGEAGLAACSDGDGVARERDRGAERAAGSRIGGLEIGLLGPRRAAADEHVGCPGPERRAVELIAVDAGGGAGFTRRADDGRVPGDRDRAAEEGTCAGIGRLEIGRL